MGLRDYNPPPNIWCSQCKSMKSRTGHVEVKIDALHMRRVCLECKVELDRWKEEILKDKYAEEQHEQRHPSP